MTTPALVGTQLSSEGRDGACKPLLVVGPSLGTSVATLWSACAGYLADEFHVVGWDLPGHGASREPAHQAFDVRALAVGVLELVDCVQADRGERAGPFAYAGDSVGGAVGLQLMLDAPDRVRAAVLLCTSSEFGSMPGWLDRATTVRESGTSSVVSMSAQRWFGPGFLDLQPARGRALLHALRDADTEGYAQVCQALSTFDVQARLGEIATPVLVVAGSEDVATPTEHLEEIVLGLQRGRLEVLDGVGHLAPVEAPEKVAQLISAHLQRALAAAAEVAPPAVVPASSEALDRRTEARTLDEVYDEGMAVRRQVLGDTHVDRATAATTDLTRDFQQLITRYAWGSIWTRPGLDRRSRSMITLTALIARGHHEELAMHLRAARTNGLTDDEIMEVILQSAIYCGVPDANTAFRVAQQVLDEPRIPADASDDVFDGISNDAADAAGDAADR